MHQIFYFSFFSLLISPIFPLLSYFPLNSLIFFHFSLSYTFVSLSFCTLLKFAYDLHKLLMVCEGLIQIFNCSLQKIMIFVTIMHRPPIKLPWSTKQYMTNMHWCHITKDLILILSNRKMNSNLFVYLHFPTFM